MTERFAEITIFRKDGGPLSKHIELIDGKVTNDSSSCRMANGFARRVRIDLGNMAFLADLINGFSPKEAYAIGRLKHGLPNRVRVVRADKLNGEPDVIARTKTNIVFVEGEPGLVLLDIDLKGVPEDVKNRIKNVGGVWDALCAVMPTLASAARVVRPSTSHGLRNKETGETYPGSGGFHAAVAVVDAADIERFLADFHDRLWLAGYGWGLRSAAGSFLERSLVDKACGSPERLIFEGPPIIEPPLEQAPRLAVAHPGDILDTKIACQPLTAAEKAEVERLKAAEKARLKPQLDEAQAKWSDGHIKRLVASGMPEACARVQVDRWIDHHELSGDFPLPFDDPKLAGATVADVLATPTKFVSKTLSDPVEGPAYGRGKAILYQRENRSLFINSFAHGGATYELKAAPEPDIEAEIDRLARLAPLDYERAREDAAKRLGVRVTMLDRTIEAKRNALSKKKPSPHEARAILDEINANNAVVLIGARSRVLRFADTPHVAGGEHYVHRLPTFVKFDDFRNFYLNRFVHDADGAAISVGHWWLKHPKRRQNRGVVFLPGGDPVVDDHLNLWTGFGVKSRRGEWGRMQEHIFKVLAAGDGAVNEYIQNWLADAVQNPDRQAEVALVFRGGQGTGKGLLGRAMCRIFGQHGRHISAAEHLTGKFNSHLQQCCFLFADEAAAPQDKKAEGALKRLVTEPTLFIEPKGVDSFEVPNRLSVMMASNHDWVVPASEKERRYVAQDVADAHQQDEAWFAPIYKEMRNGGLEAMLYDLLARDLGDWRPRQIVRTAALARQQVESLSPLDQWWFELLQSSVLSGTLSGAPKPFPNVATSNAFEVEVEEEEEIEDSGFYGGTHKRKRKRTVMRPGLYDQARRISPKLKGISDTALGIFLSDHGCIHAWVCRRRGWRFPRLADCRDAWCKRFPLTHWRDGSADWTFGEDDDT